MKKESWESNDGEMLVDREVGRESAHMYRSSAQPVPHSTVVRKQDILTQWKYPTGRIACEGTDFVPAWPAPGLGGRGGQGGRGEGRLCTGDERTCGVGVLGVQSTPGGRRMA